MSQLIIFICSAENFDITEELLDMVLYDLLSIWRWLIFACLEKSQKIWCWLVKISKCDHNGAPVMVCDNTGLAVKL